MKLFRFVILLVGLWLLLVLSSFASFLFAQTYAPDDINSNLVFWFSPDSTDYATYSAPNVTSIHSIAGDGAEKVLETPVSDPDTTTSISLIGGGTTSFNGKHFFYFNADGEEFSGDNVADSIATTDFFHNGISWTLFFSALHNSTSDLFGFLFETGALSTAHKGIGFGCDDRLSSQGKNNQFGGAIMKASAGNPVLSIADGFWPSNTLLNFIVTYDTDTLRVYRNGVLIGKKHSINAEATGNSTRPFSVGGIFSTSGFNYLGYLGDFGAYDAVLTEAQRDSLADWMTTKYGTDDWINSLYASDTFEDPNATSLDAHNMDYSPTNGEFGLGWTELSAGTYTIRADDHASVDYPASFASTSEGNPVVVTLPSSDFYLGVGTKSWQSGGTANASVAFRVSDINNYWTAVIFEQASVADSIRLYKKVSGTETYVAGKALTADVLDMLIDNRGYYWIEIYCLGDDITAVVDGTDSLIVSDSFNNDAVQVGLKSGVAAIFSGGNPVWDNFVAMQYPFFTGSTATPSIRRRGLHR